MAATSTAGEGTRHYEADPSVTPEIVHHVVTHLDDPWTKTWVLIPFFIAVLMLMGFCIAKRIRGHKTKTVPPVKPLQKYNPDTDPKKTK